ncbi:hypothetical protein JDFR1000234_79 [uncultured archaeal virus]|jgi:hypothetical protein|uniref:Uncharacterized protein n=1 Tax=uncultured archaeal virus TaxID=1960247 RepID=A0A1S5Y372_9VIRU|nr:hypothetical protein JDFR1000234_79 [uncultured archaeal virus]
MDVYEILKRRAKKLIKKEGTDYFLIGFPEYCVLVVRNQNAKRIADLAAEFKPKYIYIYVNDVFGERFEVMEG